MHLDSEVVEDQSHGTSSYDNREHLRPLGASKRDNTMRTPLTSPSDFVSDRGPAKYFHGRREILDDFRGLLQYATQETWGTMFLVQGAPGVGKTALLAECERYADSVGWKVADIDPPALWNLEELRRSLNLNKILRVEAGTARVAIPTILEAEVSAGRPPQTVKALLQKGDAPLLLTLDEAQTLGNTNKPPQEHVGTVTNVLNAIHNGKLGRPVILLAAGLGTTAEIFRSFGISRFAMKCLVELGGLDKDAERAVIQDWLKRDAEAKGNPVAWIDAISRETHGWPQHILSYVEPAVDQLDADNGIMTTGGLDAVLEMGRKLRETYYEGRADGFSRKQRHSLAKLIADVPSGEGLDEEDIKVSLTQEYGETEAEELFRRALRRGILYRHKGIYTVPIPSMRDWFLSGYAHERIKLSQAPRPIQNVSK